VIASRPTLSVDVMVNGARRQCEVPHNRLLVDLLHDDLGLHGTRNGCGQGICGCCTVLVDGEPAKACLMLAAQADGCAVTTIEGLASGRDLHPVQAAFVDAGAVQCGYCIPGMVLTAHALLTENPAPTDGEIRAALANNLCRCTGYVKIVDAVRLAATRRGGAA
jgi:carbon-monoxide dehydrogenase small subunit